jgi:phosphoglycolate phosphatase-like HAD superfamily hydrolase
MRLLLFDIDGTLIKISNAGRQVLRKSLNQVYGIAGPIDEYSFAGKTDLRIIGDLLGAAGLEEGQIATGLPDLFSCMAQWGDILFFQDNLEPCDGVLELLEKVQSRPEFVLGLQTGNSESTAKLKLEPTGIDPSIFHLGAYGSDSANRNDLLPIAWQRASEKMNVNFSGTDTIVIGDTPADIECARVNEAFSIAVASGSYSVELLSKFQPDIVLNDLSDTNRIVELISG